MVHVGIVEAWSAANVTPRWRSRKSLAHCAPPKHLSTQELPGRNMSAGAPPVVNNTGEGLAAATALIVVRTASAACAPTASATASKVSPASAIATWSPRLPLAETYTFVSCSPFHGTFVPSRTNTETSWPSRRAAFTIALPRFPVAAITKSFISTKTVGCTAALDLSWWLCVWPLAF